MKKKLWHKSVQGSVILLLLLFLSGCESDPQLWNVKANQQVITEYVESNDEFSEFAGILDATGLNSLLAVRGPFTVFLPSNESLRAYYAEKVFLLIPTSMKIFLKSWR